MDGRLLHTLSHRICAGGYYATIRGIKSFIDFRIDPQNKAYIDFLWDNHFSEAHQRGLPTEKEYLKEKGLEEEFAAREEKIETIRKSIKKYKKQYLKNIFNNKEKVRIKKQIEDIKTDLVSLLQEKYIIVNQATAESYANKCINRCKYTMMVKDFSMNVLPEELVLSPDFENDLETIIYANSLGEEIYRELCRKTPWRLYWNNCGDNPSSIFNIPISHVSDEQIEMCYWSSFYDSVFEAYERPSEDVINDDLALDAWYDNKMEEISRKNKQNEIGGGKDAKEVFVVTDKENAKKVYEANDPHVRSGIQRRNKKLQEKGQVTEAELIAGTGKLDAELFVGKKDGKK